MLTSYCKNGPCPSKFIAVFEKLVVVPVLWSVCLLPFISLLLPIFTGRSSHISSDGFRRISKDFRFGAVGNQILFCLLIIFLIQLVLWRYYRKTPTSLRVVFYKIIQTSLRVMYYFSGRLYNWRIMRRMHPALDLIHSILCEVVASLCHHEHYFFV